MKARGGRSPKAAKPSAQAAHRMPTLGVWSRSVLKAGIATGAIGVLEAMWPGLRNPFGPPKAFVLAAATAVTLLGIALDSTDSAAAVRAVRTSKLAWVLVGLVAVAALATVTAVDPRQALLGGYPDYRGLLAVLAYGVIGFGALAVWRIETGPQWFGRCATAGVLCVGGIGVLQRIGAFPAGAKGAFGTGWFVSSTSGNSSNLGVVLVVLLPLVVWAALKDRRLVVRIVAWAAVAAGILALVWTLSRGAWVAGILSALVAGVVFALWKRSGAGIPKSWIIGALIVALGAGASLTPTFARRLRVLVDPTSSTASWRLSTWRSSVAMTAARPFLGYGPNNFHFAYPAFQAPGQVDGRRGYPIVEAAHNLEIDTATSFGVPGLLLLVASGVLCGIIVVRMSRSDDQARGLALTLGISLLAGAVALQFHYVTLDSGPLLAVVLAGIVALDRAVAAEPNTVSATTSQVVVRWSAVAGAGLFLGVAVATMGLISADMIEMRAEALAARGAPWEVVRAQLSRAESLAPWEPQIIRARGTAATQVLVRSFDPAAAADGMRAFDAAFAMTPNDAVLAAERANLLLAAGIGGRDTNLLQQAATAFVAASRMDPNTGVSLSGQASALLALGRTAEAIPVFERALVLSPRYAPAWRNVAKAYTAVGRTADAQHATARAKWWSR